MDDIGKALIMAGQILMFVFASTVSIYLYSTLTDSVNGIMLAKDYSNRGDAIVGVEETDKTRIATRAEVIMAILDLKNKYEKTGESYEVRVNNTYTFTYDGASIRSNDGAIITFDSLGRSKLIPRVPNQNYELVYTENDKILNYN